MMLNERLRFYIERSFMRGRGCGVYWAYVDLDGKTKAVARNVVMEQCKDETTSIGQAPLELREQEAQSLIDELWRAGYRPTEEVGTEGVIAAQRDHIKDLREQLMLVTKLRA